MCQCKLKFKHTSTDLQDARFQKVWAKHLIVSSMGFFPAQPLHFLLIECGDICYIVMGDQDKDLDQRGEVTPATGRD